jgi:hypothetical protein
MELDHGRFLAGILNLANPLMQLRAGKKKQILRLRMYDLERLPMISLSRKINTILPSG